MRTLTLALLLAASPVDLVVSPSVPVGKKPTLTLKIHQDLKSATLELKSSAGRAHQTLGPKEQNGELVFTLPQTSVGKVSWTGTLDVVFDDDSTGQMPLAFQTEILSAFKFTTSLDEKAHTVTVVSEHDTTRIEVEVTGDNGDTLASVGKDFDAVKAGTPMTVEWNPKTAAQPIVIHVEVHDPKTATQGTDLFPWRLEIPHDDVEFESGKSDIRAQEEPKLVTALAELERAIKRYSAAIKLEGVAVKVFVLGHTDTVGSADYNRALSDRRARAIAGWFKKRGVTVPIYARGFGEDMPKVETPDNTPEPQNRRAEYDVSVEFPSGGSAGWTRL